MIATRGPQQFAALAIFSWLLGSNPAFADDVIAHPCALLSDRTASAATHQAMAVSEQTTRMGVGQCWWTPGGKSMMDLVSLPRALTIQLNVHKKDTAEYWDHLSDKFAKPSEVGGTAVPGLADHSIWKPEERQSVLVVQKGDYDVDLTFQVWTPQTPPITLAQATTIAQEALSHL
jgi:hypothetical protein